MVGTVVGSNFSVKKTLAANFIAGIGWGVGATIGLAFFLSLVTWIFAQLGGIPVIGRWFAEGINVTNNARELKDTNPRLDR